MNPAKEGAMKQIIMLNVNDEFHEVAVEPHRTLLEVLRDTLGLTGTKIGCDEGRCGSCTVLVNGKAVRSCVFPARRVQNAAILTIEGLAPDPSALHPLQEAFIHHGAVQCGFCTPGMLMAARAFLNKHPDPDEKDIREGISGNVCRCTGYAKIVAAILDVAKIKKDECMTRRRVK